MSILIQNLSFFVGYTDLTQRQATGVPPYAMQTALADAVSSV